MGVCMFGRCAHSESRHFFGRMPHVSSMCVKVPLITWHKDVEHVELFLW